MTRRDDRRGGRPRDPNEGVRLLGADEAAEAMERDDIRHRFDEGRPRFGDRPAGPPVEGPRPALRFPLGSDDDPNTIERPPVVPVQRPDRAPELSHWAGSAAEEVPHMSGREPRGGDDTWSGYDPDPRWRDDPGRGAGPAGWPDPEPPRGPAQGEPVRFDEPGDPAPGRSVFEGRPPGPTRGTRTTATATSTTPATARPTTTSTTTRSTTSRPPGSRRPAAAHRRSRRRHVPTDGPPIATCAPRCS